MLRTLLPKASDPNPAVSAGVIMCLGELASVGGEDVMPHVPDLMQVIIAKLTDSSIVKRDAALHTLGRVCSNTGYVIQPLVDHPQLLQILSRILRTEPAQSARREVVKILGILGALDPYRRKARRRFTAHLYTSTHTIHPQGSTPRRIGSRYHSHGANQLHWSLRFG